MHIPSTDRHKVSPHLEKALFMTINYSPLTPTKINTIIFDTFQSGHNYNPQTKGELERSFRVDCTGQVGAVVQQRRPYCMEAGPLSVGYTDRFCWIFFLFTSP